VVFRDQTEALRARIEVIEGDLEIARARGEEREEEHEELVALRAKVRDLEAKLGEATEKEEREQQARRVQERAEARAKERAKERATRAKERAKERADPRAEPAWGWDRLVRLAMIAAAVAFAIAVVVANLDRYAGEIDLQGAPTEGMILLAEHPSPPPPLAATVNGNHSLRDYGCRGYIPGDPLLVLRAAEPTRVRLWTTSSHDLVLFMSTEDGQIFCDDDLGERTNPSLTVDLPPGDHRLWVGTRDAWNRYHFELHLDPRAGTAATTRRGGAVDSLTVLEVLSRAVGLGGHAALPASAT